ncbi:uncharacterized protein LOC119165180 isoform X3 [Rhipicephalus microplus]|uniref:uncharacterized protein LOC119165180 isoform X3 n=1 Tax=Rhipicephalus microplus TaxID=6941 RepID=UPI003F6BA46C
MSQVRPISNSAMIPASSMYETTKLSWVMVFLCNILAIQSQELAEGSTTVYPELLEQRNEDGQKVLLLHNGYTLNLFKASVLADTFLLRAATDAGVVEKYVSGSDYEEHLHQDARKQASLILKPTKDGHYHVFGLLNFTHRIEPLISQERSASDATAHRISRVVFNNEAYGVDDALEDYSERADGEAIPQNEERALPSSFTIEIFSVSDSKHSSHFHEDEKQLIEYMIVFWNAVSLRFQQLNPPGFISLIGIETSTNATEKPYVSLRGPDNLVSNETLLNFERWLWRWRSIRIADVVFLVTARDVVQIIPGGLNSGAAGVAFVGHACTSKKGAIAEDNPSLFTGVNAAAHELGHLLGCVHDGTGSSSQCPANDGYLMNPTDSGLNVHKFSACSKTAIATFLKSPTAFCLKDTVRRSPMVRLPNNGKKLPGEVLGGDDYCKKYLSKYPTVSYVKWASDLSKCKFRCKLGERKDGSPIYAIRFAFDGTHCDGTHSEKVDGHYYERHLYQDTSKEASLIVKPRSDGHYHVTGLLNYTHRIEPLTSQERSSSDRAAHKISKVTFKDGTPDADSLLVDGYEDGATSAITPQERALTNFIIELYSISDYPHTTHFGDDRKNNIDYLMAFWNGVSLRMQQLYPPGFIAIVALDMATSEIDEEYLDPWQDNKLVSNETLVTLRQYTWSNRDARTADAVFLVTGRDLVDLTSAGIRNNTAGVAYLGQACRLYKVGIAEDDAGLFSGVHSAAHELGHLLSSHHDGEGSSSGCPAKDGYLMNPYTSGRNLSHFSNCSKKAIAAFLQCTSSRYTTTHFLQSFMKERQDSKRAISGF